MRLRPSRRNIKAAFGLITALALSGMHAILPAQQTDASANTDKDLISVTVEAPAEQPGKIIISEAIISIAPNMTGSINDVFRIRSDVQFDLMSRNSMTGGDITPPRISIYGAEHYENNFRINGVSNNTGLNPAGFDANLGDGPQPVGDSQALFISPDLLESITVYTSNVPAEYGEFLGGVVAAKIREPRRDALSGRVQYRFTQDSWARQHYHRDQGNMSGDKSVDSSWQPRFTKHAFSASIEGAVAKNLSAMLAYTEHRSSIPLYDYTTFEYKHDTHRKSQNIMLQLATHGLDSFKANLVLTAAPYEGEYFIGLRKDSDYKLKGGGYSAILNTEAILPVGKLSTDLSFVQSEVSRDCSGDTVFTWKTVRDGYANWGSGVNSFEGTMGDYIQDRYQKGIKSVLDFNTFGSEHFKNTFKIGAEFSDISYKTDRAWNATYGWSQSATPAPLAPQLTPDAFGEKSNGVITGEQWSNTRSLFLPVKKKLSASQAAAFVEDLIKIKRVTLRPGVRVSYDDISENTDIAPRFTATWDIKNNNKYLATVGYNRYYGTQIVSRGLSADIGAIVQTRTRWDSDWEVTRNRTAFVEELGDLDTPYSDELAASMRVQALGTLFELDFVQRRHRDQIRTIMDPVDGVDYMLTNTGKSDYWGVSFAATRNFDFSWAGRHEMRLSATRSETESNSRDMGASYEQTDMDNFGFSSKFVIYNGELIPADNLPANNYNSPWVVVFSDKISLCNDRLRLYNLLRYESATDGLAWVAYEDIGDLTYVSYKDKHYSDTFNYDLTIEYDVLKYKKSTLTLRLEIMNVLDSKNEMDVSDSRTPSRTYSMGRQFFAGMRYQF